ncbi:MAG: hypothetical protein ACOCRZ_01080 [Halothermotrichaceae bacterium]
MDNMNIDQLDLKIILGFTNAYENLYEKGEISEEQFNQVLTLLDNYKQYNIDEFKNKLNDIFEN